MVVRRGFVLKGWKDRVWLGLTVAVWPVMLLLTIVLSIHKKDDK